MNSIKKYLEEQQFNPKILGIFTNPFYFVRHELYKSIRALAPNLNGLVLDVGCGEKPYESFFTNASRYVGMEFDSPDKRLKSRADIFYNGRQFPFEDNSFDGVLATEVLEHIFNPDQFLAEIRRVLKPGGRLLLTCPFIWDEHEQPFDYARYSSFGLNHLLNKNGFEIIKTKKNVSDIRAIFQLVNAYIYKKIAVRKYAARLLIYAVTTAPMTILGIIFNMIIPKNSDLYLTNVIMAKK